MELPAEPTAEYSAMLVISPEDFQRFGQMALIWENRQSWIDHQLDPKDSLHRQTEQRLQLQLDHPLETWRLA